MKIAIALAILFSPLLSWTTAHATTAQDIAGAWIVDLTAAPGEPPYLKSMTIAPGSDGTITGAFYDSSFQAGRWMTQAGRTCVAFRTSDGAGPYHSAACLIDGAMVGQTWAEGRNFVFLWTARRGTLPK